MDSLVVDIVLQGGGPDWQFVEIEDARTGESIKLGEWVFDGDGMARIRVDISAVAALHAIEQMSAELIQAFDEAHERFSQLFRTTGAELEKWLEEVPE